MPIDVGETGRPWTEEEVGATVGVYFRMLRMQESGQQFVKADLIRRLAQQIPARSRPAIEYKFRNISSVLNGFGVQAVSGYKPASNVQSMLIDVVAEALSADKILDEIALKSVENPVELLIPDSFEDFVVAAPKPKLKIGEQKKEWGERKAIKRDYLERESRNRSLGQAGELMVMEYEAKRLHHEGAKRCADRIEHVSSSKGDGLGYDILSFDSDGRERYIEVKTTAYDAETPFFISPNEVRFSEETEDKFHLYRLFSFRRKPKMFSVNGPVSSNFRLDPASFKATLLGVD